MIKLDYDLSTQLDNPIICALALTVIFIIIMVFVVSGVSFTEVRQIFVIYFMISICVLYLHYKQMKNKFYMELVDDKTESVIQKLSM